MKRLSVLMLTLAGLALAWYVRTSATRRVLSAAGTAAE